MHGQQGEKVSTSKGAEGAASQDVWLTQRLHLHSTNSSQFFVSLRPCPHLKGKHVVLGRVVKGFETIVAISKMPVDAKDRPLELITIQHCGELERKAGTLKKSSSATPCGWLTSLLTSAFINSCQTASTSRLFLVRFFFLVAFSVPLPLSLPVARPQPFQAVPLCAPPLLPPTRQRRRRRQRLRFRFGRRGRRERAA